MAIKVQEIKPKTLENTTDPVNLPPLQDWANAPKLENLKQDLEASRSSHDTAIGKITDWRNAMKVEGKYKPKPQPNRSSVQPMLIRKQAEWRYSALSEPFLGSDKLYDLSASTALNIIPARQHEILINWQFRTKIDLVDFIDDYVRSCTNDGTVIVRPGWDRTIRKEKQEVTVYDFYETEDPAIIEQIDMAMQMLAEDPDAEIEEAIREAATYSQEHGFYVEAIPSGTEKREVEVVAVNKPSLDLIDPDNVYIDPSCLGKLDKAKFAIIAFETSQAELKAQTGIYKNLKYVNWANATPVNNPDYTPGYGDNSFNFSDNMRKRVTAYEYWGFYDIHDNGELVPIVATWIGNTMIRLDLNPFPDQKIPLVIVPYMPVTRSIYGEADAALLTENQQILGALTRGAVDLLARSANSQTGIPIDYLDPFNMRLFQQGNNYTYNPNADTSGKGIVEHKYPELPQSALVMMGLQNQDAESMTGVKSFSGGVSGEAYGDVAAGIRGALDAASKREMGILRRLAAGIKEIGKKIIAMNQEFLSEEEVVKITDSEYVTIRRADIQGDFELIVDISTAEIDAKKSAEMAMLLQTMGPNLPFDFTKMILTEIARLSRMPDLVQMIEKYEPEPDPAAEQMKQLQLEEQQLKNDKIRSEIEVNNAKRAELLASASQKDINAQNDADGTTHSRDMEKQRGQAEGNQDYKITEALLRPRKEGESEVDPTAAIGYNTLSRANTAAQPGAPISSVMDRDQMAAVDPRYNLNSQSYDPALDPGTNLGVRV